MILNLPSYTKINLGLKILNKRPDGYHNISTIFQQLDYGDFIKMGKIEKGCKIISNVNWIPTNKNNICYKAYKEIKNIAPGIGGIKIEINKIVPIGSGLGGGSANAAAVLKGVNTLYSIGLTNLKLEELALNIGADVPFFINGGVQVGMGTGEKLTKIKSNIAGHYLLIIPKISIDTKWAFDQVKNKLKTSNSLPKFSSFLSSEVNSLQIFENDFEKIVIPAYPEIGTIKLKLKEYGASFASLSGSGSTVYGVFNDEASLKEAELFFHDSHLTVLAKPKP